MSGLTKQFNRYALIIGIGAYPIKLSQPIEDADCMQIELEKLDFDVCTYIDATKKDFISFLHETFLPKVNSNSIEVILFYFSGHGRQIGGENYLIPKDAEIKPYNIKDECIAFNDQIIKVLSRQVQSKLKIYILDTCREYFDPQEIEEVSYDPLYKLDDPNTIIVYATSSGKKAFTGRSQNSIYTEEFLKVLRDEPELEIQKFLSKVAQNVKDRTEKKMVPWVPSSFTGEFYFKPPIRIVSAKPVETDILAPKKITESEKEEKDKEEKFKEKAREFLSRSLQLSEDAESRLEKWAIKWNINVKKQEELIEQVRSEFSTQESDPIKQPISNVPKNTKEEKTIALDIYNCLSRLNLKKQRRKFKEFIDSTEKKIGCFSILGRKVDIEWLYNLFLNQYISNVKPLTCFHKKWERIQSHLSREFQCKADDPEVLVDSVLKKLEVSHIVLQIPFELNKKENNTNTTLELFYQKFLRPLSEKVKPELKNKLLIFFLDGSVQGKDESIREIRNFISDLIEFSIEVFSAQELSEWYNELDGNDNYYTQVLPIPKEIENTLRQWDSVEKWNAYMNEKLIDLKEDTFEYRIYLLMKYFQLNNYYEEMIAQCLKYKI